MFSDDDQFLHDVSVMKQEQPPTPGVFTGGKVAIHIPWYVNAIRYNALVTVLLIDLLGVAAGLLSMDGFMGLLLLSVGLMMYKMDWTARNGH